MKLYNVISIQPLSERLCVARLGSFADIKRARKIIESEIMQSDIYLPECVIVEMSAYRHVSDGVYFSDKIIEAYANTKDIHNKELIVYVIEEVDLDEVFAPSN
jgi:hypothetical protein